MRYLWRKLTGRCTKCGQRLEGHQSEHQRVEDLNTRAETISETLGRPPRAQNCVQCNHIIFEGEHGFIRRCLLVDIV